MIDEKFNYSSYMKVEPSHSGLVQKFRYLKEMGLKEYEREALSLFNRRKLPQKTNDQIIEQIVPRSISEHNKRTEQKLCHESNVVCFLKVMRWILPEEFIEDFAKYTPQEGDLLIYNYYHFSKEILFDSICLLKNYEEDVEKKDRSRYLIGKSPRLSDYILYQYLRQVIFGQLSFHANRDRESYVSLAVIRQMIELRLRRAFGILGWYNNKTQSYKPIPMSDIFELLKSFQDRVDFSVPLCNIKRIYQWASVFFHLGLKDFLWKPIFVIGYLRFFMGGKKRRTDGKISWKRDWGITLSSETLLAIRDEMIKSRGEEYKLISCEPEVVIENPGIIR